MKNRGLYTFQKGTRRVKVPDGLAGCPVGNCGALTRRIASGRLGFRERTNCKVRTYRAPPTDAHSPIRAEDSLHVLELDLGVLLRGPAQIEGGTGKIHVVAVDIGCD